MKRRVWLMTGGVVVASAIGIAALQGFAPSGNTPDPTETPEPPSPITAKGTIVAKTQSKLGFRTIGVLTMLPKVGDRFEKGQVISSLDTSELDLAVRQSEDNLAVEQALIAQAESPTREVDLAALEAAYEEAKARHQRLLEGATADEIKAADSAVYSAESSLAGARAQRDQVGSRTKSSDIAAGESALGLARANIEAAKTKRESLDPTSQARQNEIRNAELALEGAKNSLWSAQIDRDAAKGFYGSGSPQGKAADARVAAGETAVTQAQATLEANRKGASDFERRAADEAIKSAEAEVRSAQARIETIKIGATTSEVAAAESSVRVADAGWTRQEPS